MKKLMLFIFVMILLVGVTSALEFDNRLTYSKEDLKVEFRNSFLGIPTSRIGTAEIKSHTNVNDVITVPQGRNIPVMYYDFNFSEEYEGGLGEIIFTNKDKNEEEEKDYYFAKAIYRWQMSGRWINCKDELNAMGCEYFETGLYKNFMGWERLENNSIPEGEVRIALMTDVKSGDYFDGVWTIVGKKVSKHAQWTERSLIVDIFAGYPLNQSSGTNVIDIFGVNNGTLFNMEDADWVPGLNNFSLNFDGGDEFGNLTNLTGWKSQDEITVSFWLNTTNETDFSILSTGGTNRLQVKSEFGTADGRFLFSVADAGGILTGRFTNTTVNDGQYHLITISARQSGDLIVAMIDGINHTVTFVSQTSPTGTDLSRNLGLCTEQSGTEVCGDETNLDEIYFWTRMLNQTEVLNMFTTRGGFTDNFNPQVTIKFPTAIIFNLTQQTQLNYTNNTNAIFCWNSVDGGTTNSSPPIRCQTANFTGLLSITGTNTWTVFVNDSDGNENSASVTFNVSSFTENNAAFDFGAFETETKLFSVNLTTNGSSVGRVGFIYGSKFFTGVTVTNTVGDTFNLSRTIVVPIGLGSMDARFNFTSGGSVVEETTSRSQAVSATNLTLCGVAPQDIPYFNFTFRNETLAEENITATIDVSWTYSLSGLGTINKTLSFLNATENNAYTFCFNPSNRTVNTDLTLNYNNDISQQRSFALTAVLSNVTTTQILYLLPTSLGLFSQFVTVDTLGRVIPSVKATVTRILGGSTVTVGSGFTDGSGFISFFTNPDALYTGTFEKSGFTTEIFTFTPITDLRTVTMAATSLTITNGTEITLNTTYQITPVNTTLLNNTNVTFGFNVTSEQEIIFISLNITNSTGHQLGFASGTSAGFISDIVNTSLNDRLFGTFILNTSTESITITRVWLVSNFFTGDYSIFRQLTLFNTYGFKDFFRLAMILFVIFGTLIFITKREIVDTAESKVMIVTLLIWAFSIVGWLDSGLAVNNANSTISQITGSANQYGIAIIITMGGAIFFVGRRIFIRRP